MPSKAEMTWEPKTRRWFKMYRGHRLVVSCRQLNAPPTKEGSLIAANEWFYAKRAEIDGTTPPKQEELARALAWSFEHGNTKSRAEQQQPSEENQLGSRVAKWLATRKTDAESGLITPDRFDFCRIAVGHFVECLGDQTPVDKITDDRIRDFYEFLKYKMAERKKNSARGWSNDYCKSIFGVARQFVRSLRGVITLPQNITDHFEFKPKTMEVQTFPIEQARELLKRAPGQLRLHLHLMANCGMTQQDIADLKHSEIDYEAGRIIRKRSKTGTNKNVPIVNWKLWGSTIELLRQYKSDHPELALTTQSGTAWITPRAERLKDNGRVSKTDNIKSNYAHLRRRLKIDLTLKHFRSTSATLIAGNKEYRGLETLFCDHSEKQIIGKHYVAPNQELFDEAIDWLGVQFGVKL